MAGNGASGRRPTPTRLKLLRGNPGRRPLNTAEPQPTPGRPSCPAYLTAEAKREWRRITTELDRLGLLTLADRAALAAYCQSWARYRQAEEAITRHGSTFKVQDVVRGELVVLSVKARPEVVISQRERQLMKAYLIEFGLSPASRARLKSPEKREVDPFAELSG